MPGQATFLSPKSPPGPATPLHRALRSKRFRVSPRIVRAMGIASLGTERDPDRIADALGRCSNDAWDAIAELFLATHYPRRLCSTAPCPRCGARNDVEAPFEREFALACTAPPSNAQLFPGFDTFDARACALYERIVADRDPTVALVVDSEIPACDVGGEPLLGAHVPPGGDVLASVGRAEIILYYRSFAAMWREDGPYDWSAELEETLRHELVHHAAWRTGHDPMDDEERDEMARTREVLVGRAAVSRADVAALALDIRDFVIHSWPIWLIIVACAVAISVCGR
jgi:Zincin-like metallopeptidase